MTFFTFCALSITALYLIHYFWIVRYDQKIKDYYIKTQVERIQRTPSAPLPNDIEVIKFWLQRDKSKDKNFETVALPLTGESMSVHEWLVKTKNKSAIDVDFVEVYEPNLKQIE